MTDTKRLSLHGRLRMAAACPDPNASLLAEAADAIKQHEAFRQEVSDAVEAYVIAGGSSAAHAWARLERFIIAKPDPLVEVCREIGLAPYRPDELRAALATRGLKIVEDK